MSQQRLVKTKGSYVVTEHSMSRQSFLELCSDRVFLCRDRDLQDKKFSMSRHSVLCCDSEALHCVAKRLGTHEKYALSRQTSYSGTKKKKKKTPGI